MSAQSLPRRLLKANVVLLVVAMLAVIPLLSPFAQGPSGRAFRNGLFETMGVLMLVVLLARIEFRGGISRFAYLLRTGVNAPLAVLLIWAIVGALRAPDRSFAIAEILRLGTGALIYLAVALHVESRSQLSLLIDYLIGMVIFVTGYGLLVSGDYAVEEAHFSSIFPNAHHLSAVLCVLLPLLISVTLKAEERGRQIAAMAAAIMCGAGLLLTQERSAWIAVATGLLVWFFLSNRSARPADRSWRATLAVAAFALLVAVGFLSITNLDAIVSNRAQAISAAAQGRDRSFAWRVQKWRGTAAMIAHRPLWGWGPGEFVLHQLSYTHLGALPADVRRDGASFDDMGYNEYLQTAAELGLPGLALYLLILFSFFSKGSRALARLPEGLRRTTLLGCMAGASAQMVDAVANGSWRYPECTVFLWLVLGMGVAVVRMAYQTEAQPPLYPAEEPIPIDVRSQVSGRAAARDVSGAGFPSRG
jgi:putative inorganic carbon (HCO3(-)) transporter